MSFLRSKLTFLIAIQLLASCQSKSNFEIISYEKKELHVVKVSSGRVVQQCYFLNAEKENNWRHQYLLHILNDKNEVITAMHPVNQDDDQCNTQMKKIAKILKQEPQVTLCLRDALEKESDAGITPDIQDFGSLGKHTSPYDYLTFDTICNSRQCYSISNTWTYTCPEVKK